MSLGLTPIPGDKPTGQKLTDDPDLDACKAEIDKIGNPDATPEWKHVVNHAPKVLGEKSKDLRVATWYAIGLLKLQGLKGLCDGLVVVRDLVKTFWDGLFPERIPARATALKWMLEKGQLWAAELEAGATDREALSAGIQALEDLAPILREKIEGTPPSVTELVGTLRGKLESVGAGGAPTASAGGDTADTQGETVADTSSPAIPAKGGGPAGPIRSRDEAFKRLEEIIKFLKKTEPHSPIPLLLQRALEWSKMSLEKVLTELIGGNDDVRKRMWEHLGLKEAPPADSGGSTT